MTTTTPTTPADPRAVRRKRLAWFGILLATTAVAAGAWAYLSNPALRHTDDAYVGGQLVQITSEMSGAVTRILADNTDWVAAGDVLVELDSTDARIELASAKAELAQAVRSVRGLFASDARSDADVRLRLAEFNKAQGDLNVKQTLVSTGAVSRESLRHANDALSAAQAALASAQQARAQALALVNNSTLASNPPVQVAAERVRAAALAIERTKITAPVSGMVAQRSIQLGRRVGPGEKMMTVVPLDRLWIDANFKEVQLHGVCVGQPATVTADIYGRSVTYHGTVRGIEAGTGAAFALLPAQNATGNWIKVVQRTPVRISLDPAELIQHPLRIGMSAEVEVDTATCDPAAAHATRQQELSAIHDARAAAADAVVRQVIADNIGADR
ncbi:secretion protein HlyD family protein [Rhodopseudomonas palustris TIE-1]|uniref:HlyD family secretion protein n=1 Tax=Rhodopseudomonas palustris TaxID=1076 RepID=UPI00017798C3|nr:efflux RND transporter periplasmic adaptor subunit [Rhodopseudomonas palustris]ACF02715.1 secretion protein HlyD family protein [Rhodopseudomonas palustris TIE-1]